jgi:hypothetical protein
VAKISDYAVQGIERFLTGSLRLQEQGCLCAIASELPAIETPDHCQIAAAARIVFDLPGGREAEPTIKVRGLEIVGLQYDLPTASCPGVSLDLAHDAGAQTAPAHLCGHDQVAGV